LEGAKQRSVNVHDSAVVLEFSAIVWSRKNCYKLSFTEKFITLLHNLMGTANKVKIVLFQEVINYISSKNVADPSFILPPTCNILLRI
jgi:hypothetical protein